MNLELLKEPIPFRWRIQSFSQKKAQGQCVPYIDARDAQNVLDNVCGAENWQDIYYEAGGLLFCKVGIRVHDEWVWKSDTGKESYIEKEKGHASDAFKRACVKWGIFRFGYELGTQYIKADMVKTKDNSPSLIDNNGKKIWNLTSHINSIIDVPLSGYLKKMKGFSKKNTKIYKAVLAEWQLKSATQIKNPESQIKIIEAIEKKISEVK